MAAAMVAATIFAVDSIAGFDVSVSILYLIVLALVARGHGERAVRIAVGVCVVLAVASWLLVHERTPDLASVLRLSFSVVVIVVTGALLISRKKLLAVRAELEESRTNLLNFTNSVPQLLWRTDADGKVDFFNRRYTDLTGHDHHEAIALQNWGEWFHADDIGPHMERFEKAQREETELRSVFRMLHADGSYRWMSLMGRPVRSPSASGEVLRWYGGTSDVHDEVLAQRKVRELKDTLEQRVEERTAELMRTEARYASLFDVSNIAFAEQDLGEANGIIADLKRRGIPDLAAHLAADPALRARCFAAIRTVRVNSALVRLLGYDAAAESVAAIALDAEEVMLRQLEMAFKDIGHIEGRTLLVGKDGRHIPVFYTVNRLGDGRQLSSYLDLTEAERVEEMRRAAHEELARANRIATVGAFSASIAHELNQPIASLVVDAHTGLRWLRRESPDVEAAGRVLERVARTAERVAGIVKHTREAITGGRRAAVPINLCALAFETRELLDREVKRAQVTLDIRCSYALPHVLGDPVELQQVLINLIGNAVEAMQEARTGDHIVMTLTVTGDMVTVSVTDDGPGFAPGDLERLFQPFYTTKPTGVGMGLQICRTAVQGMGGELRARARPEGGAEFWFELPLTDAEDAPV
jgi:PAS domain S-box-containing protein